MLLFRLFDCGYGLHGLVWRLSAGKVLWSLVDDLKGLRSGKRQGYMKRRGWKNA